MITKTLIPKSIPPNIISLKQLLDLGRARYGAEGLPNKKVAKRLNKNKFEGLIDSMNSLRLMCFLIYRFHDITILMLIETALPKKNDPVPKFKK